MCPSICLYSGPSQSKISLSSLKVLLYTKVANFQIEMEIIRLNFWRVKESAIYKKIIIERKIESVAK
jgi:hypothetical protein